MAGWGTRCYPSSAGCIEGSHGLPPRPGRHGERQDRRTLGRASARRRRSSQRQHDVLDCRDSATAARRSWCFGDLLRGDPLRAGGRTRAAMCELAWSANHILVPLVRVWRYKHLPWRRYDRAGPASLAIACSISARRTVLTASFRAPVACSAGDRKPEPPSGRRGRHKSSPNARHAILVNMYLHTGTS